MATDAKRAIFAAAFERLAGRVLAASSAVSEGTREAIKNSLAKLRARIDDDADSLDAGTDRPPRKSGEE